MVIPPNQLICKYCNASFLLQSSLNRKSSLNQTSFSLFLHFGKVQFLLKSKNFLKSDELKSKNYVLYYFIPSELCYLYLQMFQVDLDFQHFQTDPDFHHLLLLQVHRGLLFLQKVHEDQQVQAFQ